ncbi:MAG TPA: serine O-acetyltransferase [Candidatus Limiplasma sp.]|nr:serine O-acetyltransferase [Candidatus Limiplasma sp.]
MRAKEDMEAVLARDPAARSRLEVRLCYPGLKALRSHRVANSLFHHGHILLARIVSQRSRHRTGIEIHPGAEIGRRVFIDHGDGVVIGETTVIGDDVTIYQGVTLGGTGKDVGKRHPTIGSGVTIGAGAKVLGPITIGDHSKVGAGAIVLKDVPPECTVVGNPGRIVKKKQPETGVDLDQIHLPDPMLDRMETLYLRLTHMEKCLARHAKRLGCTEADSVPSDGGDDGRCTGDCSKCPDALPEIKEDPYADL